MINTEISYNKKNLRVIFITFLIVTITIIYTIPSVSFRLGDVFFGGIKPLYNVQIAQILYKHSVNPFFSQKVPYYAHHQLSRTYFIQGDLWTALDEAKKELEIYPENTGTYYILGLTYGYMNRPYEAIDAFSQFIETHPTTWAARNDKAWLQFRIGNIEGAIQTIDPIVEQQKYNVWVQNTYCALMINKKEFEKAKDACDRAKSVANVMTDESWGVAYPGNDPRIYSTGIEAMRTSINNNLKIITEHFSASIIK